MRLSKYVHAFEKDNNFALWHSLSMKKVYGSSLLKSTYIDFQHKAEISQSDLANLPSNLSEELINNGFIVSSEKSEMKLIEEGIHKSEGFNIKNLVLLISDACNFNCEYCQIEKNIEERPKNHMSKEVATRAIELFKEHASPSAKKTITITGGEPLLNKNVLRFIVEKIDAELENKRIVMFTNGSLLDKDIIDFLKEYDVLVLISIDGPQDMHDRARKFNTGAGTFLSIIDNYHLLRKSGVNVGISAVGGPHNMHDIKRFIDFVKELGPASIGLNFSHLLINQDNPMELSITEFGEILMGFYKEMRKHNIFVENISRVINAFASEEPRLHECQAEGNGFTVDARGKIGPCKSLLVSDVFSFDMDEIQDITQNDMFVRWNKRTPLRNANCQNCSALMLCGGGCAYDSYITYKGEFEKPDERICDYQRSVLDFLMWDLFDELNMELAEADIYFPSSKEQVLTFNKYYDQSNNLQRSVGHDK